MRRFGIMGIGAALASTIARMGAAAELNIAGEPPARSHHYSYGGGITRKERVNPGAGTRRRIAREKAWRNSEGYALQEIGHELYAENRAAGRVGIRGHASVRQEVSA